MARLSWQAYFRATRGLFKLPPTGGIIRLIQAVMPMCDKCQQLETRIQRYRKFLT